jgi:hypothetical protein
MLYWECKRRLQELRAFRDLVVTYFKNRSFGQPFGTVHENDTARKARNEISLQTNEAVRSCFLIGAPPTVFWSPPPVRGGPSVNLNLVQSMFELHSFRVPASKVIDSLDRAIGDYNRLENKLRRNLLNPLYWLHLGFVNLLGLPFRVLGAAGFDAKALEQSVAGKLSKAILGFVTLIAAVLEILSLLGFSPTWQHLTGLLRHK